MKLIALVTTFAALGLFAQQPKPASKLAGTYPGTRVTILYQSVTAFGPFSGARVTLRAKNDKIAGRIVDNVAYLKTLPSGQADRRGDQKVEFQGMDLREGYELLFERLNGT